MKRFLLFFATLCLVVFTASAQDRVITGTVTDEEGEPLIGVSVLVKGTTTGSITDLDGKYSLSVPTDAETLVFSYVGFTTKEISIAGQSVISTNLGAGLELKEVVVSAMGIEREKKALGYSVQEVSGESLVQGRGEKALEGLQAKVPGLNILSSGGDPGKSTRITIRGIQSFGAGGNSPLIIVDGVPLTNSNVVDDDLFASTDFGGGINSINPNDIESVTVLKGAAATNLYGVRAQNGVIVITTKKGGALEEGEGKMNVDFGYSTTFSNVLRLPQFQNTFGQGWVGQVDPNENTSWGPRFDGKPRVFGNVVDGQQQLREYDALERNVREFFETGIMHNTNLAMSGGNQKTSYYFSFSNTKQDGILPFDSDTYDRNTLSLKGSHTHKKLTIATSLNYSKSKTNAVRTGQGNTLINGLYQIPRNISILDLQDLSNPFNNVDNYFTLYGIRNPYQAIANDADDFNLSKFFGSASLNYNIVEGLDLDYRFGFDFESYTNNAYTDISLPSPGSPNDGSFQEFGSVYKASGERLQLNHDVIASYKKQANDIIGFNLMSGLNVNQRTANALTVRGDTLILPGFFNVNNTRIRFNNEAQSLRRIIGVFGEVGVSLKNQLYLTANMRNDWSSTLPEQNRSFFYWGVSSSWVWSELLKSSKVVDYGKLRASYGTGGGDADPYNIFPVFVQGLIEQPFADIEFPLPGINSYEVQNQLGDINLQPQFTKEYEFGVELSLFKSRITLDAAYYNRITENQIVNFALAPETGFSSQYTNFGKIRNRGVELLGNFGLIRDKRNVSWDVFLNFTKNNNLVLELPGDEQISIGGLADLGFVAREGMPLGLYEATVFLRNDQGQIVVGADGLPIESTEQEIVGDMQYDYTIGFGTSLSWKGLKLNVLFDGRQGGVMFSRTADITNFAGASVNTLYNDRQPFIIPNSVIQTGVDDDDNPIYSENTTPVAWDNITTLYYDNDAWVARNQIIPRSFFKLREVSLSYSLPDKLFKNIPISNLSVYFAGRNLALWTPAANGYIDPESTTFNATGLESEFGEFSANPTTRNFTFGVNIGF